MITKFADSHTTMKDDYITGESSKQPKKEGAQKSILQISTKALKIQISWHSPKGNNLPKGVSGLYLRNSKGDLFIC